jgi:protein SCO1
VSARRRPWRAHTPLRAVALAAALAGFASVPSGCARDDYNYSGVVAEPPTAAADVVLSGADGQVFHSRDLAGKWVLVFFGYTHCPDICPLTLAHVGNVLRQLGPDADRVRMVFVSVDPERDPPERLRKFASTFGPQVIGVTGTRAEIDQAVAAYGARYEIDRESGKTSAAGYSVSHSGDLYVIDPQQRLRLTIPFGVGPDAMLADLRHLMQQSG